MLVRWIARLSGARDDRARGIEQLYDDLAERRFIKPFAKLLLAVAALRDHESGVAQKLISELQQEFPQNPLYAYELNRLNDQGSGRRGAN